MEWVEKLRSKLNQKKDSQSIKQHTMRKKIMLLGSGELGKEFVIACQRLGQYIIAVDSYENAPAMQVANEYEVISMLDGSALDAIVAKAQTRYHCS
ncbi:MAG: hypothetical protein CM15mP23_14210 [Cryomorphaceae bacterium]|nr:MAG: hypothetical protein CM15mP23_14210 [Cryomorphaceae bacterium]